jgi:hypothetical protein
MTVRLVRMSYDLTLFPVAKGEDVADVFFRRAKAADADDPNPGPGGDERQVEKREWMRELQACVPGLEPFAFDYAAIAESGGISETEARRRWRHIELNDDATGLQVTLYDESADVTMPYWHEGEAAARAFEQMFRCAEVLADAAGFAVFDPQLDQRVDAGSAVDRGAALARYLQAKRAVERAIAIRVDRRPWWKLW